MLCDYLGIPRWLGVIVLAAIIFLVIMSETAYDKIVEKIKRYRRIKKSRLRHGTKNM